MSEKEGILKMQPSGRWAICRPGHEPVEITSGELFSVEVADASGLQLTRMEYRHGDRLLLRGRLSAIRRLARCNWQAWVNVENCSRG
jgi:hypothetical protein